MRNKPLVIVSSALLVALGLAGMGYFIGSGMSHIMNKDRYVNVRGLAEREVQADKMTLTVNFSQSGESTADIYPRLQEAQKNAQAYLTAKGFAADTLELGQWTSSFNSADDRMKDKTIPRLSVLGFVKVHSGDVNAAQEAYRRINELMIQTNGAVIGADINFEFTGLGALRAEMIAAATKDARNAALQFAADSGNKVGSIRNASQGVFQITAPGQDSDDTRSMRKNVRVVTTVDYELRD